ncbi:NupC/NupG family nucleoside CNT transporter [Ornithinimicrobium faecis]|uniref:NupC/NupG family nucleoside CNT transporter n=1 Tax=Ornithinimicrobium faecis TaxID=2934158 RepID=A0ABY4YRS6_9MICO|nr:nucleoside transporter C-terminal domain-containing protein [Ornithinimicrobium sp. HY1793]USQ79083.1 NupC/NupG family nucleoside CNT transporter [Ornithinimicrobium sp. HY1793]
MTFFWGLAGVFLLLAIALLFSVDRRKIRLRTVGVALLVQVIFGALVLYWPLGQRALTAASDAVQMVIDSANAGIEFVFGPLLESGFTFAIQVLPVIIFVASLTSVLFYLGILQWVVKIVGGAFAKLFGTTTAESMNTAANIFLGHTEAPLLIKPYLKRLTQSELFAVMTGGMATVAGSVLVGYALMGVPLEFLIAAAFMAAPGALVMAKIVMPAGAELAESRGEGRLTRFIARHRTRETVPATAGGDAGGSVATTSGGTQATASGDSVATDEADEEEARPVNVVDAAARGAGEGLQLVLNIAAMLIAFIGLIALVNVLLGAVGGWFGYGDLRMQSILGWLLAPVMFVLGVPWAEAAASGSFVGQKIVLNEFVAFSEFGPVAETFSVKTQAIVTFALTGFANFAAIAMQIGALGSLAPNQRTRIAQLGMRAVLAGTLANLMSATIAGVMVTI